MSDMVMNMPTRNIYEKAGDARLWSDTEAAAERTGRSVSDIVAEGLRLFHAKQAASVRVLPLQAQSSSPLPGPVPDPFAAKD